MHTEIKKILVRIFLLYPISLFLGIVGIFACFNFGPAEWYEKYIYSILETPISKEILNTYFGNNLTDIDPGPLEIEMLNLFIWTVVFVLIHFFILKLIKRIRNR